MKTLSYLLVAILAAACTQDSKSTKRIYGQIEVDEIDVASRLPSRVKRIAVKAGQAVKAGDLLVELEDDVLAAKRKQAESAMAAAESKRNMSLNAVRPEEKEQLRAAVTAAKKQMDFAKSSLSRSKSALTEGAISQQQFDEIEFKYQAAAEAYHAAVAKQRMANVGARDEEKAGAQALVEQAKGAVAEVDAYAKDQNLLSPIDGEVSQILIHEGELAPTGYPVLTLLKMSEIWVTFQVAETELTKYPMGQAVELEIPALGPAKVQGKVSYLSAMAGFANRTSTQDRGTFDIKTFEVRATLESPDAKLRPGMTATLATK